jgi:pSer/pThr/pTyr-binding forkhead associated (FHA) protein
MNMMVAGEEAMDSQEVIIPPKVRLVAESGENEGESFNLTRKTMTIGRADVCDIQLSDRYVSNKHCQIVFRKDHFTAIDLNSLNKTKVNDQVYIQKNLKNGDVLTLGKTRLRFVWEDQDQTTLDADEDILGEDAAILSDEEGEEPETPAG